MEGLSGQQMGSYLTGIAGGIHQLNVQAGWWEDLDAVLAHLPEGSPLRRKVEMWFHATKIALIHSEVSEMLEGLRKGLADEKLSHRSAEEVEAADIFIRLFDYCGRRNHDVSQAVIEKIEFNSRRADHKPENRDGPGGKAI